MLAKLPKRSAEFSKFLLEIQFNLPRDKSVFLICVTTLVWKFSLWHPLLSRTLPEFSLIGSVIRRLSSIATFSTATMSDGGFRLRTGEQPLVLDRVLAINHRGTFQHSWILSFQLVLDCSDTISGGLRDASRSSAGGVDAKDSVTTRPFAVCSPF